MSQPPWYQSVPQPDPLLQPLVSQNRPILYPDDPLTPMMPTYEGRIPLWRQDDIKQPAQFYNGHVDVFDLSIEDDWNAYNQVVNAAAHGQAIICREESNFDTKKGTYIVFVRWMERYYAMVEDDQKRVSTAADASIVYPNVSQRRQRFAKPVEPQETETKPPDTPAVDNQVKL